MALLSDHSGDPGSPDLCRGSGRSAEASLPPARDALPPVHDVQGRLVVRAHAAVVAVALDPVGYANAVSSHLQVPNGLDGEEHRRMRDLLDPFLSSDAVDAVEPTLHVVARDLVADLAGAAVFDAVGELGARFAVRAQSRWLGWSADREGPLLQWVADSRDAIRRGDAAETARLAVRFDGLVVGLLDERRGDGPLADGDDVTSRLLAVRTEDGRALTDPEIVSVLRNWTGGDLTSLALCAGVVVHALAVDPSLQERLARASARELDAAIDEILRADDPFVSNRRRATRDGEIQGCPVHAGDVVVLDWREANVDPRVFDDPYGFDPHAHSAANLVYGIGPHACPGRELATRELRVLVQRLLAAGRIEPAPGVEPTREEPPVAGFRTVPVRLVVAD